MEKVSMIDNQKKTIKSPYLSIKFPYKNIKIEVSMNKLFTILAIADATRNQSHINKIMETLDEVFAHCTSIEDYARISYVFDKAQRLGGLAQEIAKDVLDKLNEKEEEMLSKLPKDSKVTCTIPEVDGIYSKYRKYKDVAGINTKNAELRRKSIKYIQALQFADNSRRTQDFENLKVAIRNVIHECKDEKDFDDVERMLSELKNIGGIAVNIYPVASNMNKQAKDHFLEQKRVEEKKAKKQANKTPKALTEEKKETNTQTLEKEQSIQSEVKAEKEDKRTIQDKYKDEKIPKTKNEELNQAIIQYRDVVCDPFSSENEIETAATICLLVCEEKEDFQALDNYLKNLAKHGGEAKVLYEKLGEYLNEQGQEAIKIVIRNQELEKEEEEKKKRIANNLIEEYNLKKKRIADDYIEILGKKKQDTDDYEHIIIRLRNLMNDLDDLRKYISPQAYNKEMENLEDNLIDVKRKLNQLEDLINTINRMWSM